MKKKSLANNALYNLIRNIVSLLFPLITLPYVSKILGVDNIGKYNFAYTFVGYFLLIAAVGISGYAIREGARIRDDRKRVSAFLSEMFSINIICTIISILLMVSVLVMLKNLHNYKELIFIFGLMVVFSPLALTWLYTIYEDFAYITIRTVVFQVISLILLVMLVKKETDVNLYAFVTVFSNVGSNIFNYLHSKHYCDIRFTFNIDWKRHFKPIMVIFITSIAITIYVSSDITILGLLCGDYNVGLYSTSVKVYTLLKNGLVSILSVVQARLAFYIGTNDIENFQHLSNSVINILILLILPIVSGVIALNQEIVMILASEAFIKAGMSMSILMIAIIFNIFAQFLNTCILMPYRKENAIFWLSIGVAVLNIILNFMLIPRFAENAAAFTTLLAEVVTCIIEFLLVKKYIQFNKMFISNLISAFMGCVAIGGISYLVHYLIDNKYLIVLATLLASIIVYFLVQILMRNSFLLTVLKSKKFFCKNKE